MGVLTKALGFRNVSMEDPAQPLLPFSALMESLGIGRSDAGVMVNEKQAMRITTLYACIKVISEDLSSLPLPVMQKMPDGSIREATEHRLYPLLHDEPNANMTSMVFRGAMLASVLGWGNSYTYIRRDRAARAVALVPLPSSRTSPVMLKAEDGSKKLMYATTATEDGLPSYFDPSDVLHIPGLSFDGFVRHVADSDLQECLWHGARGREVRSSALFGNSAKASGVLSHPGQLSEEAQENLKKSIREIITGESALRPLVLEEGMKWEQLTINPHDAQFIELRQFQRSEIASLMRVAMHLLQDLQRATNNNIEHQSLDHIHAIAFVPGQSASSRRSIRSSSPALTLSSMISTIFSVVTSLRRRRVTRSCATPAFIAPTIFCVLSVRIRFRPRMAAMCVWLRSTWCHSRRSPKRNLKILQLYRRLPRIPTKANRSPISAATASSTLIAGSSAMLSAALSTERIAMRPSPIARCSRSSSRLPKPRWRCISMPIRK